MMTRIVKSLFFLGLAALIGCFVAPNFIDWNKHKDEVIAQIQPYFQRKITVTGNVSFKVLPQPEITMENVSIANGPGAQEAALITLKSLEARVKLEPLLEGQVEVENINLTEPVLNLDVAEDGKTNLSGVLTPSDNMSATASAVKLNQVSITNGKLHYYSQLGGIDKTFDNLNLSITAGTLLGPYKILGDMLYEKTKVNVDTDLGAFDKDLSAEMHVSLLPADDSLPQIKLNGDINLNAGLNIEGDLSVVGKPSGLVNIASLSAFDFMADNVEMTGTLQLKSNQLALNNVKANFGKSGSLSGKVLVQFVPQGKNSVDADIAANGLVVTSKPSDTYMSVPPEFQGSLHFRGKNVVWNGRHLDTADIVTSFGDKDWMIKSALVVLPGNSQIRLTGTVSPATNSAAYTSVEISTDDLGKMVDAFAPDNTSIFSVLGGAAPFRKVQLTTGVDITPAKISFYSMDATLDDKEKISGVMNIERVAAKPNIAAKLHLTNWDSSAFPDVFVQSIMKSDADLELTADNFSRGTLKVADLSFKGKTDGQGLAIQELSGHLTDKDSFSAAGRVATLAPAITGLDVNYVLKSAHPFDVAKSFGVDLPPLTGNNFDLKGELKDDVGKYSFTAQGSGSDLTAQGLQIDHPSFSADVTPSSVKISSLTGTVWDGKLAADILYTEHVQPAPSWSSTFKGSLKQADLQKLQDTLGFAGFTTGVGDADFELASADNTAKSLTGTVGIQASTVTVNNFNTDKLADTLHQLTSMPDNLQKIVDDSFRKNGPTVFKDVQCKLKVEQGNITIDTLTMANAEEKLAMTGSAGSADGRYKISGILQLSKTGFPPLKITRSSGEDYKIDSKQLEDYVIKNLPPPPPAKLPADTNAPAAASLTRKSHPAKSTQPIGDILQRLDESDATAPTHAQAPPKPAPAQPDVNKIMQQMQMQEMMQQGDGNSPLPLTSP